MSKRTIPSALKSRALAALETPGDLNKEEVLHVLEDLCVELGLVKKKEPMKHVGLYAHRLRENPEERRFAEEWEKANERGNILAYLLDLKNGSGGRPVEVASRDIVVAATVIQWLGSPVGGGFLRDVGYRIAEGVSNARYG